MATEVAVAPIGPAASAPRRQGLATALLYTALALAGQGAALALVDAGPTVRYQHLRPDRLLHPGHAWAGVVLLLELAVCGVALRDAWPSVRAWLARTFAGWRLGALALLFGLTSATLSRQPGVYVAELALATLAQLGALLAVVLAARALPASAAGRLRAALDRVLGPRGGEEAEPGGVDRFALLAALWVVAVAALLAVLSYARHPHVPDEVSYVLQARHLARGMIAMPAPPVPEAFNLDLMWYEPARWFSPFPPGWPALLAVGVAVGVPWLVNPLLGGANVMLAYLFLRELYQRRTARLGVLLLCASPWHLFMTMSLMSHTFSLAATLLAALAVARLRRTGKLRWGWLGGIAIGIVALMRPLEGVAVAGMLGLWTLLASGWRPRQWRIVPSLVLAAGTVIVAVANVPYNRALTGSPFRFPVMAYFDVYYGPGVNDLGFGANRGVGWALDPFPGHGPLDVLVNASMNAFAINVELLGWATGSLLLLGAFVLGGRPRRPDWLMLAAIGAIVGIHSLYWFSGGPDFGARYWYLVLVPCIALTARGLEWLAGEAEAEGWGPPPEIQDGTTSASARHRSGAARIASARVYAAAGLLAIGALLLFVPWRAVDKYRNYRGMRADVRALDARRHFGRSVVLVRGRRFPDYASAAVYNAPDVRDPAGPVYVWDRNQPVREAVLRAYADRPVWVLDGPSVTRDGYRVSAGPLPPGEALRLLPPNDGRWNRGGGNTEGVVRPPEGAR